MHGLKLSKWPIIQVPKDLMSQPFDPKLDTDPSLDDDIKSEDFDEYIVPIHEFRPDRPDLRHLLYENLRDTMALPAEQKRYTFADYLTWDGPERFELLYGEPVQLAAPSTTHQMISMELSRQFANFLEGKRYRVISAPFDVRLFETGNDQPEDVETVVQPDLSIVCDQDKLDEHGCKGAPDLTLEILSASNARHDLLVKLNLYQLAGVREYWIVSPEQKTVQVFRLESGVLSLHEVYGPSDIAKVNILDGCFIELSKVFAQI